MDFRSKMDRLYGRKVIEPLSKKVRAVALEIDRILVQTTPVDTGRARANWLPTLNTPSKEKVDAGAPADILPVLGAYKITDTIFITNNLPYIQRLNDGYSKQAPAGFVEAAIAAVKRTIKK